MDDEFRPSFSSSRVTCTCSAPSRKAEIPRAPGVSGSVRAKTSSVSEYFAFVIHCFWPEISHSSPSRVAAQRRRDASEPTSGSESANAPIVSPRASRGTNRDFCSSVPQARIGSVVALVCTATVTPTPASARDSCSSTRMYERKSAPAPPYSSGTHTPISPTSASRREDLLREAVLAVPVGRVGRDLGVRQLARERLDLLLLRCQLEVHRAYS